jgi:hypothetical protein
MTHIDHYELSLSGHQRLIDARDALCAVQEFVGQHLAVPANSVLVDQLKRLTLALNEAVADVLPVDGLNAFLREAGERDFVSLAPRERQALHEVRCCSEEGIKDIFRMIQRTVNQKPRPYPE